METINNYIKTEMPRIINIIKELFTTPLGYIILGVLIILTLLLIKYHELVEGTKCYSALLPIPLIKEYLIIKITTGKIFAKLYVIIIIVTTIMKQLPISEYVMKSINITNMILIFFLIINIVLGIIKFTTLWFKEISVNRKYKKMELIKQKEKILQNTQTQNVNNSQKTINNNQQNNINQPINNNNYTPTYTEELSFKPNENAEINNNKNNNNNNNNNNNQ